MLVLIAQFKTCINKPILTRSFNRSTELMMQRCILDNAREPNEALLLAKKELRHTGADIK